MHVNIKQVIPELYRSPRGPPNTVQYAQDMNKHTDTVITDMSSKLYTSMNIVKTETRQINQEKNPTKYK